MVADGKWRQVTGGRWWQVMAGGRCWQVAAGGDRRQVVAGGGRWWQITDGGRWVRVRVRVRVRVSPARSASPLPGRPSREALEIVFVPPIPAPLKLLYVGRTREYVYQRRDVELGVVHSELRETPQHGPRAANITITITITTMVRVRVRVICGSVVLEATEMVSGYSQVGEGRTVGADGAEVI